MRGLRVWLMAVLMLCGAGAWAQGNDISGVWNGTLKVPGHDLRMVMKVAKGDDGKLTTVLYSVDQGGAKIPVSSTAVTGTAVKLAVVSAGMTYEGKLNAGGTGMTGTFTQGGQAIPLDFEKTTEAGAYAIPEPPAKIALMAKDAKPVFEVATIKPSTPGQQGLGLTIQGRSMKTVNTPVSFLIAFAYDLHPKQIVGAPAWVTEEKYDIVATPDVPGQPNTEQLKAMVKQLLADRFGLKYHREKKEMAAFVLAVAKSGSKLTVTDQDPAALPLLAFTGLGSMVVKNSSMEGFAHVMQTAVLDRPVVDETKLKSKYDFTLKWTPDDSQFGGMGVKVPPPADGADAPPDLFKALPDQLGLVMTAEKVPVETLVVDHVDKASAN